MRKKLVQYKPRCLYRDRGELFPELVWEVRLRFLAPDVVERVGEVPLHLRASLRRVEALDVFVDQGN